MKIILIIVSLFTALTVNAQATPEIETDRPDQTETPFSVGKKMFQAENGFTVTKYDDNFKGYGLVSLLRFGLSEKFELRAELSSENLRFINSPFSKGLLPVELGFKVNIAEEKGLLPKTSLITHFVLPKAAGKDYKATYMVPNFRFTMQHSLSKKQSLSYNIGGEWGADDGGFTPLYTLATGYDITGKLYGYIELFGFFPQKTIAEHSFDGGLAFLVKPNLQLDISAGVGLTKTAPQNYWALGLSFRLPK
jgi:hypothetical protein